MKEEEVITHDGLAHSLALHLLDNNRMVWEDIQSGIAGSVRPDVFTLQKSFSKPNPITYEIKVSVSDFRSDITKGKWQQYLKFSYGVVFAAPKGLISKDDVPKGCGLMYYNGDGLWRTVRKPTINPIASLDTDFILKLLVYGDERQSSREQKVITFDEYTANRKLRKKYGDSIAYKMSLVDNYKEYKEEIADARRGVLEVLGVEYDPKRIRDDGSDFNFKYSVMQAIQKLEAKLDAANRLELVDKEVQLVKRNLDRSLENMSERIKKVLE